MSDWIVWAAMRRIGQSSVLFIILLGLFVWIGVSQYPSQAMPSMPPQTPEQLLRHPSAQDPLTYTIFMPYIPLSGDAPSLSFVSQDTFSHPGCSDGLAYHITFSYIDDGDFPHENPGPTQVFVQLDDPAATTYSFLAQPHITGDGETGQGVIAICIEFNNAMSAKLTISMLGGSFPAKITNAL
ncbi:MAG: hypothetical protein AAF629_00830 [Chloroflexota bacterium]